MIVTITVLKVFPEKQLEVKQTLFSLIDPVREEPGCLRYGVFCDISDKNRFTLLEEWQSLKDFERHIRSFRFGVLLGTKPLLSEPPRIQIHTVTQTQGMEVIHAARKNTT